MPLIYSCTQPCLQPIVESSDASHDTLLLSMLLSTNQSFFAALRLSPTYLLVTHTLLYLTSLFHFHSSPPPALEQLVGP
jgi:hypothetical protein